MQELTIREAAVRLGLSRQGVLERLRAGTLRGRLAGGAVWLIPVDEVRRAAREPPKKGRRKKAKQAA